MSCEHECPRPPVFPASISNRPALERIAYRIGDYARLREHMLARLDRSTRLAKWTHRTPDDPGIALLEATAVVGDILTFYQSLYANEVFLRTAAWRESVGALVRLLGYRLAPGVGGEATFAVAVDGDEAVTVPAGFGFKAQLEGGDEPAEFESTAEVTAHPALGEFRLYRPRKAAQPIASGETRLEIQAVDGDTDLASKSAVELAPGDRLMLVPATAIWEAGGGVYSDAAAQKKPEILVVKEVETILDRVVITIEGSLVVDRGAQVVAFKIDRSFRHFGHNAPRTVGSVDPSTGLYDSSPTKFERRIDDDHSPSDEELEYYSALLKTEMPLDTEVDDLAAGGKLVCEGFAELGSLTSPVRFTVVREIQDLRSDSLVWGGLAGSASVLTLNEEPVTNADIDTPVADIRRLRFHETVGPELRLRAPTEWYEGPFVTGDKLGFFGTWTEAAALAGRSLLLQGADGSVQQVQVTEEAADLPLGGRDEVNPWMWWLTLDQLPESERQEFDEEDPQVTAYGNLVPADQGKTESEAVLGSGDARQAFQSFALPKSPLTYLLDESQDPAQVPELEVWVDGIRWQQVDTFFSSGPSDQVYVVREDDDGTSWVQFGDGKTGARLPSGKKNIVAAYRTGIGATGALESGAKASATGKLKELKEVFLPAAAAGGDQAESRDNARIAAPGTMQSLGRLVSVSDFESEAQALPGVAKVRASWTAAEGFPLVRLVVLTESGDSPALDKVRDSMATYNRCRGPARFPIVVVQGLLQYLYLDLQAGFEPARRSADIEAAIRLALGVDAEDGLFSLAQRQFGQGAHLSQIVAAVQQVDGVSWVQAVAAQPIPLGSPPETDPAALAAPDPPALQRALECQPDRILALDASHLVLSLSSDASTGECET